MRAGRGEAEVGEGQPPATGAADLSALPVRVLDGASFEDFAGFCAEVSRSVLAGEHAWHGNLDAFNDILRGGFGTPEGPWVLRWRSAARSREVLGQEMFEEIVVTLRDHGEGGGEAEDGIVLLLED